jgi:glutamine amidotransferase
MGWNAIRALRRPPLLDGIEDGAYFYFVHSYHAVPQDRSLVALEAEYSSPFCAMIWRDNIVATQFHPEKSQTAGLQLLKNFAQGSRPAQGEGATR